MQVLARRDSSAFGPKLSVPPFTWQSDLLYRYNRQIQHIVRRDVIDDFLFAYITQETHFESLQDRQEPRKKEGEREEKRSKKKFYVMPPSLQLSGFIQAESYICSELPTRGRNLENGSVRAAFFTLQSPWRGDQGKEKNGREKWKRCFSAGAKPSSTNIARLWRIFSHSSLFEVNRTVLSFFFFFFISSPKNAWWGFFSLINFTWCTIGREHPQSNYVSDSPRFES